MCVNGRVVDGLESRNGTQSTTVAEPVQAETVLHAQLTQTMVSSMQTLPSFSERFWNLGTFIAEFCFFLF